MSRLERSSKKGGLLTLEDFKPPTTGSDRRCEPRIPCDRQIAILPFESSAEQWSFRTVGLFDCSSHGLGIVAEGPMPIGGKFFAKLKCDGITLVLYEVRYCQPVKGGLFKIGAQFRGFVGQPRSQDVDQLLTALSAACEDTASSN